MEDVSDFGGSGSEHARIPFVVLVVLLGIYNTRVIHGMLTYVQPICEEVKSATTMGIEFGNTGISVGCRQVMIRCN